MKKVFIAFVERGRVKGKLSGAILKLEDRFQHLSELEMSSTSNRGVKAEVIAKLVDIGELPKEALDNAGYPNYSLVNELADIAIIEGLGLNFYSIV